MSRRFDAIIIGAGQAGPPLAGRLTKAGMQVAVIERHPFGGTCVNTGCMPTKTMVASAYAAHDGRAENALNVIIPSMPGYGFSGKPTAAGWGPDRIARAWAKLMRRLGYTRYVAQGGDWGSPVSSAMARQAPAGLLGIHMNLPAIVPPDIAMVLASVGPAPAALSEKERAMFDTLSAAAKRGNRALCCDDGRPTADDRLRPDRLSGRPCGMDARTSGLLALDFRRQRS